MLKRSLTVTIAMVLFVSLLATPASAQARIKVFLDGTLLSLPVNPIVEQGVTLVPMRSIFEALNAKIVWDSKAQTVTGEQNGKTIKLTIGKSVAYIDSKSVKLAVPAKVIQGNTMVPLRFVAEALGSKVEWRASIQSVLISSGNYSYAKDFAVGMVDLYVVNGTGKYAAYKQLKGYTDEDKYAIYFKGGRDFYSVVSVDTRNINLKQVVTWKYNGKTYKSTKKELHSFFADTAKVKNYLGAYNYTFTQQWYKDTFGDVYQEWSIGFSYENEAARWVERYFRQQEDSNTISLLPDNEFEPVSQTSDTESAYTHKKSTALEDDDKWTGEDELESLAIKAYREKNKIKLKVIYGEPKTEVVIDNVPLELEMGEIYESNGVRYQVDENDQLFFFRDDLLKVGLLFH